MPVSKRRKALIAQIEEAFADTVYPDVVRLTDCNRDGCWECDEIQEYFQGKHWSVLKDAQLLNYHADALVMFKPEAFRFYFPGFMLICLRTRTSAWRVSHNIEFMLTPPKAHEALIAKSAHSEDWAKQWFADPERTVRFLRMIDGFSLQQKQAINAFVHYYFKPYFKNGKQIIKLPIEPMLDFWHTFAD